MKKTKNVIAIVSVILLVILLIIVNSKKKTSRIKQSQNSSAKILNESIAPDPIKKSYHFESKKIIAKKATKPTRPESTPDSVALPLYELPNNCEQFISSIINISQKELNSYASHNEFNLDSDCLESFKKQHQDKVAGILAMCKLSKAITRYECDNKVTKQLRLMALVNKTKNIPVHDLNFEELGANTTLAFSSQSSDSVRNKEVIEHFYNTHGDNNKVKRAYREYLYLLVTDKKYKLSLEEKERIIQIDKELKLPSFESGEFAPWIDADNYYQ